MIVDPDALAAERERAQDDETRALVQLVRPYAHDRLARAGWVLRAEGEDGLGLFDQPKRGLRAEVTHVWGNLSRPAVPDFTHGLGTI